jgi:hypothetical protein
VASQKFDEHGDQNDQTQNSTKHGHSANPLHRAMLWVETVKGKRSGKAEIESLPTVPNEACPEASRSRSEITAFKRLFVV